MTISWSLFWETLTLNLRTETVTYSIHKRVTYDTYSNSERPGRVRVTRQDRQLSLPRVRSDAGKRRFAYRAAHLYNKLPQDLTAMTLRQFRRALKAELLASDRVT